MGGCGSALFIAREKIAGGTNRLPENAEFEDAYARVLEIRQHLIQIDTAVKAWLKQARAMTNHGKNLAAAVNTPSELVQALLEDISNLLDEKVVSASVTKKVGLLDDLLKERLTVKKLRMNRDHYANKLEQLRANPTVKDDVQESLTKAKLAEAETNHATALTQLHAAVKFFVDEAGEGGACSLVAAELHAFRQSQFQFFLVLQKLISGDGNDGELNVETQWNNFSKRMSTKVANARNNAKGDGRVGFAAATVTVIPDRVDSVPREPRVDSAAPARSALKSTSTIPSNTPTDDDEASSRGTPPPAPVATSRPDREEEETAGMVEVEVADEAPGSPDEAGSPDVAGSPPADDPPAEAEAEAEDADSDAGLTAEELEDKRRSVARRARRAERKAADEAAEAEEEERIRAAREAADDDA